MRNAQMISTAPSTIRSTPNTIADHGKSFQPHVVFRREVIGAVEIQLVDLRPWHEFFDVDRVRAFQPKRFQLFVFDREILISSDLVAAGLIGGFDHIAGDRIDELLLQAVARPFIDLPKYTRSLDDDAGYIAIGQETSESLR